MKTLTLFLAGLLTLLASAAAHAAGQPPPDVTRCWYTASPPSAADGQSVPLLCGPTGTLQTSGGGGGGGGAITAASGSYAAGALSAGSIASGAAVSGAFADGSLVTLGAKADAKSSATDTTPITAMQVWKEISSLLQNPLAVTGTFFQSTQPVSAASGAIASGALAAGSISSGAAVSGAFADGSNVTLGAKADAKSTATDTTAITIMQVLKEISFMEQTPASRAVTNAGTFATQSAITAASGSIASGALASGSIASGALAAGSISSGAAVSGAFADGSLVTLGAKADAKSTATDTTAISVMQVLKEISFMEQTPASRAVTNAGTFAVQDQFNVGNANTQPHICGSHVFKHITTATDTQIVAQSGSTTIYVCDYGISFNGTGDVYLEKATSGTCATLTQIDMQWYGTTNAGKNLSNPFYEGLNTGASAQLCAHTDQAVTIDVAVNYDQY